MFREVSIDVLSHAVMTYSVTFDMNGGAKRAQQPLGCPLDGEYKATR